MWIDVEDLYQEALCEAVRCHAIWDPARSSYFTFAYRSVHNRMRTLVQHFCCQKRFGFSVELEVVEWEQKGRLNMDLFVDPMILLMAEDI